MVYVCVPSTATEVAPEIVIVNVALAIVAIDRTNAKTNNFFILFLLTESIKFLTFKVKHINHLLSKTILCSNNCYWHGGPAPTVFIQLAAFLTIPRSAASILPERLKSRQAT